MARLYLFAEGQTEQVFASTGILGMVLKRRDAAYTIKKIPTVDQTGEKQEDFL